MNQLKSESPNCIHSCLAWLYGRINYERQNRVSPKNFKLQNMQDILGRLGDPHKKYPVIHVAGTKGKGSVCTMLGSVLSQSGRKTGVYTSPHLETINQRMAVNGTPISDKELVEVVSLLQPVVSEMDREAEVEGRRPLTFFEITTTAAFVYFARQKCEAVVLEVGLGGRLDSTNVCEPVVTVITNISFDHTRQLGNTIGKIAFEKAGITKPGVPMVTGAIHEEALPVIAEVAKSRSAPLFVLDEDFEIRCQPDSLIDYSGTIRLDGMEDRTELEEVELNLLGRHQQINAALVLAVIQVLNVREKWNIDDSSILKGLKNTQLSGRAEVVSRRPVVVVDMGHNVASIGALVQSLECEFSDKTTGVKKLILAVSKEKDVAGMMAELLPYFDELVLTQYQDNPRGMKVAELETIAKAVGEGLGLSATAFPSINTWSAPEQAWEFAWQGINDDDLVCITGSAFLVAELRRRILLDIDNQSQVDV